MLKFSLLCAASALAMSAAAQAQEGKNPFAGFYAGVHAGWRGDRLTGAVSDASTVRRYDMGLPEHTSGIGVFGGQIGYNIVSSKGVLAGVELSMTLGNTSDSQSGLQFSGSRALAVHRSISGLALAQGKLGWAGDRFAAYGMGGFAYSRGKISGVSDGEGPTTYFSGRTGFSGWTVGVGADLKLADNVSLGAAYNYVSLNADPLRTNGVAIDQDLTSHIAKMVLNFHF